jgi:hypothetical protein
VIVALMSWQQSRRSADAAHVSAAESRRAADAAERSASAEELAVEVAVRAEEDRRTPRLEYLTEGGSGQEAHVAVHLREGPPEVDIRTIGVWITDASEPGKRVTLAVDTTTTTRVAASGRHLVPLDLRARTAALVAEVTVECSDPSDNSSRTWTRTDTVAFPAKPPAPVTVAAPPPTPPHGLFRNVNEGF